MKTQYSFALRVRDCIGWLRWDEIEWRLPGLSESFECVFFLRKDGTWSQVCDRGAKRSFEFRFHGKDRK